MLNALAEKESFTRLLRSCARSRDFREGTRIHEQIRASQLKRDPFLANLLLDMYGKCGSAENARSVFDESGSRNIFSWSLLLVAYCKNKHIDQASEILERMPQHDTITSNALLTSYAQTGHLLRAMRLFERISARDLVTWSAMIQGFCDSGTPTTEAEFLFERMPEWNVVTWNSLLGSTSEVASLKSLFDRMPERSVVSWTTLIISCADAGQVDRASELFQKMPMHDVVALNSIAVVLAQKGHPQQAEQLFQELPQRNDITWNSMLAFYARAGDSQRTQSLFDRMPSVNVVSWTTLCHAHADAGEVADAKLAFDSARSRNEHLFTALVAAYRDQQEEAKKVFDKMPEHDSVSLSALMVAYSRSGLVTEAKLMFDSIPSGRSIVVWTALVQAYVRVGTGLEEGEDSFNRMPMWNLLSWNAIIAVYDQNKRLEEAKKVFDEMPERDVVSWNTLVNACYWNLDWEAMKRVIQQMPQFTSVLWTLVAVYAQEGRLEDAKITFDSIPAPDVYSWNVLLGAYVHVGRGDQAVELFKAMDLQGVQHDQGSFLLVLMACGHAGLVEHGRTLFVSMSGDYGVIPERVHYGAAIDMLARNGKLEQAEDLVRNMPFMADEYVWGILLSACKTQEHSEIGERAGVEALELGSSLSSSYVLLSSLYEQT